MSERQQVFDIKELEIVSCKCPQCGTIITISVLIEEKFGLPELCPTCGSSLGALAKFLRDYRAFYRAAVESSLGIRLHTKPITSTD